MSLKIWSGTKELGRGSIDHNGHELARKCQLFFLILVEKHLYHHLDEKLSNTPK